MVTRFFYYFHKCVVINIINAQIIRVGHRANFGDINIANQLSKLCFQFSQFLVHTFISNHASERYCLLEDSFLPRQVRAIAQAEKKAFFFCSWLVNDKYLIQSLQRKSGDKIYEGFDVFQSVKKEHTKSKPKEVTASWLVEE